jgi:RNA polymerase sigma factor (sigma-70 family)
MRAAARSPEPAEAGREPSWAAAAASRVHRYLRCLRCPRDEAPDLVQDALLAAVRTWRDAEPPLPWLFVTARNLWFARCRARRHAPAPADLDMLHDRAVRELGDDGGDARVAALRACTAKLPPRSQMVLGLCYRDALPRAEVAARAGLGIDGLASLLARVKAALKECVDRRTRGET